MHLLYRYRKVNMIVRTPLFCRRAVVVGTKDESIRIGNMLLYSPECNFNFVGYIDHYNYSGTDKYLGS